MLAGPGNATGLTQLDLSGVGFNRNSFAHPCGQNPTVALLAAVAGMSCLRVLNLAGWRFYFATFHPLAGLSNSLVFLDLSHARDIVDGTLWSLTHLTGQQLTAAMLSVCLACSVDKRFANACAVYQSVVLA